MRAGSTHSPHPRVLLRKRARENPIQWDTREEEAWNNKGGEEGEAEAEAGGPLRWDDERVGGGGGDIQARRRMKGMLGPGRTRCRCG